MLYTPRWNTIASERVVPPEIIQRIRSGVRSKEFFANVSPDRDRDLVIAHFSVNAPDAIIHRYLRPLATSGLFDS